MRAAGRTLKVVADNADRVIVVSGFKAGDLCRAVGRPIYAVTAGGWMLNLERLPDLVAVAESRGYRVNVSGDAA